MIKMTAKLLREQTAVYFPGEAVECIVEFENIMESTSQSSSSQNEHLAWASAQIHCYRKTNSKEKTESANTTDFVGPSNTALGTVENFGAEILSITKPKILFCDLRLNTGEKRTFYYREILPRDGPPTYRGHNIKYFYNITVATQRVKCKVQTLSVPVRVLPLPRVTLTGEDGSELKNETNEELTPSNPFLPIKKVSQVEIAWQNLLNITARRCPKSYRITNRRGFVGRFCLFKPAYKLGEDIVGIFDFTNREVRCVQFLITLQCEEIYKNVTNATSKEMQSDKEVTKDTTSQQISHPLEKTGKITDYNLVDVRWRLHFEFVTSTNTGLNELLEDDEEWHAPETIDIETMIWNLPITLYPTSPLQIYAPGEVVSITF